MRPEHLSVVDPQQGMLNGTVVLSEYTGAGSLLHIAVENAGTCLVLHDGPTSPATDQAVGLTIAPENLHFFDTDGDALTPA